MAVRDVEPYRDPRLPERFLRWIEVLRLRIRTIPCYTESDGSPEGVIGGIPGDRYYDLTNAQLYIKSTIGGTTGWLRHLKNPLFDFTVTHQVVASSGGSVTFDYLLGQDIELTLTENITTVNFASLPLAGQLAQFEIDLTQDSTARTIAWPASILWTGGTVPDITTVDSRHIIHLRSTDAGVTWLGTYANNMA